MLQLFSRAGTEISLDADVDADVSSEEAVLASGNSDGAPRKVR